MREGCWVAETGGQNLPQHEHHNGVVTEEEVMRSRPPRPGPLNQVGQGVQRWGDLRILRNLRNRQQMELYTEEDVKRSCPASWSSMERGGAETG